MSKVPGNLPPPDPSLPSVKIDRELGAKCINRVAVADRSHRDSIEAGARKPPHPSAVAAMVEFYSVLEGQVIHRPEHASAVGPTATNLAKMRDRLDGIRGQPFHVHRTRDAASEQMVKLDQVRASYPGQHDAEQRPRRRAVPN